MDYQRVEGGREYVTRLEHGGEWRGQIAGFAEEEEEEGIDARLEREHDGATDLDLWNV